MESDDLSRIPTIDIQPLINRIVEVADVGTLVLLLVIFILIGLLLSANAKNSKITSLYMSQSVEIVRVLTTVKATMDANIKMLEANDAAVTAIGNMLQMINLNIESLVNKARPRRRRAKKGSDEG